MTPDTRAEKFETFERINSIRETNGNLDSCNSCKRLVLSRLRELHESKFPFVSRIEFIRSKLSNLSVHVSGVIETWPANAHQAAPLSAPKRAVIMSLCKRRGAAIQAARSSSAPGQAVPGTPCSSSYRCVAVESLSLRCMTLVCHTSTRRNTARS